MLTPEQFKLRRKALFRSQQAAAAAMGLSVETVGLYEIGVRRDTGKPVEIPLVVELALCELERRAAEG